jgi:thioredoxin-like negative regulator of GroEL
MRFVKTILPLVALAAISAIANAREIRGFDQRAFDAAQRAGRPVLVDIKASWCPTCSAQEPILQKLTAKPEFKNLIVFVVDYDPQKAAVRAFGAQSQSTLIAFNGARETSRSVGDTNAESIDRLLHSALN